MSEDRALTPPEEQRIRRALASVRTEDPIPPDVSRQLDKVLTELNSERAATGVTSVSVARPFRMAHRGRILLVAAAALVVLGVGNQMLGEWGRVESSRTAATGDNSAGSMTGRDDGQAEGELAEDPAKLASPSPKGNVGDSQSTPTQVNPRALGSDLKALRDLPPGVSPTLEGCRVEGWGAGIGVTVEYQDRPAVVIYREPRQGRQRADLFYCGATEPARSVLLPAP
jgi:hypothetical protein